MKLHYSQTGDDRFVSKIQFDYHMKLHYSQTGEVVKEGRPTFDYHMKLHYSQTSISEKMPTTASNFI